MKKISYSQYSQWAVCPHKWKLNYIDGLRTFKGNIHTLFGSAMHDVLQTYLTVMYNDNIKKADALPSNTAEDIQTQEEVNILLMEMSKKPND